MPHMKTTRRLLTAIILFVLVALFGTVGYMSIEHRTFFDSLYMTVITITTIGFEEVWKLSTTGRVFTLVLIVIGLAAAAYSVNLIMKVILEGELKSIFGRKKVEKEIAHLKDHFIICGYGRIGRIIASGLRQKKVPFVVIDRDDRRRTELEDENILFVIGDSTSDEILLNAGVKAARCLISVTRSDSDNVFITLSARQLNPDLYIVARAEEESAEPKLRRAGANKVVLPYRIGATQLAQAALRPNVIDFLEITTQTRNLEYQIEELKVSPSSPAVGKSLIELAWSRTIGIIIIGIKRPTGMIFNPSAEARIQENDILIALGSADQLKKLEQAVL
jgi:voltage-gated potassium channel